MEHITQEREIDENEITIDYLQFTGLGTADGYEFIEVSGKNYTCGTIPEVTQDERGASYLYHDINDNTVPKRMVESKSLFEILERDSLTHEGYRLRVITDETEAQTVMDDIVRKYGNLDDPRNRISPEDI